MKTTTLFPSFLLLALVAAQDQPGLPTTAAQTQANPPTATPLSAQSEAEQAYSEAVRTIRALRALPASASGYARDPYENSFLATLFPNQQGPIANSIRILYRLRYQSWLPKFLARRLGKDTWASGRRRDEIRGKALKVVDLLEHAIELGHQDALYTLADVSMFPPSALPLNASRALGHYARHAEITGSQLSQSMLGFFYATGFGDVVEIDQAKSLLYYTFAAMSGDRRAQMAMGYRHWAGISVNEDCMTALGWYESAAEKAMTYFKSGPPGGHTLPPTITRLSDLDGGVYGPGASVASTGSNAARSVVKAANSRAAGETWEDVLEYYQYHADRDEIEFSYRLGKIFYHGSVYSAPGGAASGAEGVGLIQRDFHRARAYFVSITRLVWPASDLNRPLAGRKQVEERVAVTASMAAGYLGRMYLRGEGVKQNIKVARMWFERGGEFGDRECHNGLGYIYRDGLLDGKVDLGRAISHFKAAAGQDLADAQVQLGKYYYELGEYAHATTFLETAIRHGSPFEAYYYLAEMAANQAHDQSPQLSSSVRAGSCSIAVSFYKLVAERGSWEDDLMGEAEKMWGEGMGGVSGLAGHAVGATSPKGSKESDMRKEGAKLRWMIAAEAGSEIAQNNMAYLLDKETSSLPGSFFRAGQPSNATARLALTQWIRSAAQRNVDALVKVGDYYYHGLGVEDDSVSSHQEKAVSYYHAAVETQLSALAMWNLGWMYENGAGVEKDFHMAKRYYDMALETNSEAKFPVYLSLLKLYARSIWHILSGGTQKTLVLWGSAVKDEDEDDSWYSGKAKDQWLSRWRKSKVRADDRQLDGVRRGEGVNDADENDAVQWAHDRQREEVLRAQAERDADNGYGPEDFFDGAINGGPGGRGNEGHDEIVDDLLFMVLLGGILGTLLYLRTRWMARRDADERQRREAEEQQRQQQ